MKKITLYAFPGSCSNVSTMLLEEAQADYQIKLVNLMKGEHKKEEFLKLNPKGKVPAIDVDGVIFTENPAIIPMLSELFPDSDILPKTVSPEDKYHQISDLCFISATVHPMITRLCKPEFFAPKEMSDSISERASLALDDAFKQIESKLPSDQDWWYGDQWSAMDAYINWVFNRVIPCGFDVSRYPRFVKHNETMQLRPAVQRAMEKINQLKGALQS